MKEQAAEFSASQGASLAGAGASLGGSIWAIANEAAQAVFGIPIGVVLAAAAGAFFARTFTPAAPFWPTLRAWFGWTLAGAYTLPLALHLGGWPSSVAASVAFVFSCVLQLLAPAIVPVLVRNSPAWVRSYLDGLTGAAKDEAKQ